MAFISNGEKERHPTFTTSRFNSQPRQSGQLASGGTSRGFSGFAGHGRTVFTQRSARIPDHPWFRNEAALLQLRRQHSPAFGYGAVDGPADVYDKPCSSIGRSRCAMHRCPCKASHSGCQESRGFVRDRLWLCGQAHKQRPVVKCSTQRPKSGARIRNSPA